ncbi:hypothetical protein DPV79_21325 [Burkholderia reimsis]|uniref:Uncharacterized protein n=1 Tax=Burkholderia reimsis TaxID=2234132 RepID=A0A365QSB2_9BURK|nr:hypothetical protein [Burkholderia reimsis]RBB37540.1 hypothetical protein DPV79_21325 [Burkholderia reimsis]
MAVAPDQLYNQIKVALDSAPKLSAKDADVYVTVAIAKNFNQLLELAKEAMPEVDKRRWPDALDATPAAMGPGRSNITFAELRTLYGQLMAILAEGFDPTAGWGLA